MELKEIKELMKLIKEEDLGEIKVNKNFIENKIFEMSKKPIKSGV